MKSTEREVICFCQRKVRACIFDYWVGFHLAVTYSICITCRNNINTVEGSLESILSQTNDKFEIIIVDAKSNDETLQVLQEYAREDYIKLIVKKCSRGKGRQIAFENSTGRYIVANMDLDDIFEPKLLGLLNFYHRHCEGKILHAHMHTDEAIWFSNITIGPRTLISKLGGWRDLQYCEDWDLWSRAAKKGCYRWTIFPMVKITNLHVERQSLRTKLSFRYMKYREMLRLGRSIFDPDEKPRLNQRIIMLAAKLNAFFKPKFHDDFNETFTSFNPRYRI